MAGRRTVLAPGANQSMNLFACDPASRATSAAERPGVKVHDDQRRKPLMLLVDRDKNAVAVDGQSADRRTGSSNFA